MIVFLFSLAGNSQSLDQLISNADSLMDNGEFEKALSVYQQAYKKDSSNYDLIVKRGFAYWRNDMRDDAFLAFTKAIKLKPDSALAYIYRGQVAYSKMWTEESIIDYTRGLDRATNDEMRFVCFSNRGVAKIQKRDFQGAYEDFTRALLYRPDEIGVINNMATVLDELGRSDEAIKHLKRLIVLDSTFVGGYVNLGFQYTRLKKYKEAIPYFDKALKLDPQEPLTWNNRGLAKYHLNDLEGALKDINKSLSIYKENSYAYKNRALVYISQKKKDLACQDLRKALEYGFEQMYGDEVNQLLKEHCQ